MAPGAHVTERNWSDVKAVTVTRIPGMMTVNEALLACDNCGVVPTSDENGNMLLLSMVRVPDRKDPLFLGPKCLRGEQIRYVNGTAP